MTVLGAVLAGGRAARFGCDKAMADHAGRPLVRHVIDALTPQCDAIVVVGGTRPQFDAVPDWPGPELGPLGGLAGALHHAAATGHDAVLSAPCDVIGLPGDLVVRLGQAPAFVADCPVIGLWPLAALPALTAILTAGDRRAMRTLTDRIGARAVWIDPPPVNINRPGDLMAIRRAARPDE